MITHAELMQRLRAALADGPKTTRQLCLATRINYTVLSRRLSRLLKSGDMVAVRAVMTCGMSASLVHLWSMPAKKRETARTSA